jgi:TRAP-type C4-dicarboxylate transport system permease small subunit
MTVELTTFDQPGWVAAIRGLGRQTALLRSVVTGLIMMGIVADVVRRSVTGRSIPGMIEMVETFMAIEVFLGLAHAEATGVHVRMSLATNVMPFPVRRAVKSFGMFVCMVGSVWFAWASTLRALEATAVGEVKPGLLRFPVWPARWAIAIGFAVLAFEYLARTWEEWNARPTGAGLSPTLPADAHTSVFDQESDAEDGKADRIIETLDRLNEEDAGATGADEGEER